MLICTCIHIYIYVYTYIYIHMQIHIHSMGSMPVSVGFPRLCSSRCIPRSNRLWTPIALGRLARQIVYSLQSKPWRLTLPQGKRVYGPEYGASTLNSNLRKEELL